MQTGGAGASDKRFVPIEKEKKAREPKGPNLYCRAYKFRLSPTKKQVGKLEWMLLVNDIRSGSVSILVRRSSIIGKKSDV